MVDENIKKVLLKSRPFKYLQPEEIEMLLVYSKIISFSDKEHILKQGQQSVGMYILVTGGALVTAKTLGKEIIKINSLEQGDFVGEFNLIQQYQSTATVIASGEVKCLLITTSYFEMLSVFFPQVRYKITKALIEVMCEKIDTMFKKIKLLMSTSPMATLSVLGELIKSLKRHESLEFNNAKISQEEIHKMKIFQEFSQSEFNYLLSHTNIIQANDDSIIIKEGDKNASCFIVLRGAVQSTIFEKNKACKLAVLGPMEMFGHISYFCNRPAIINYTTCETAILLKINYQNLKEIEQNNISVWYKLFNLISRAFVVLEHAMNKLNIRLTIEDYHE